MNRAIFLDRDGVIIESQGHVYRLNELKFIPKSLEGLKKLQNNGNKIIIITNQSGIAKGLYHHSDYMIFREEMHKRLEEQGIILAAEYFCPHHKEGIGKYKLDCNCRKPKTGMLEQAARDFDLDLKKCWMIGDKDSDILAGKNAGCRTIHVLTGEHKKIDYSDFVAGDLIEAANYILRDKNT